VSSIGWRPSPTGSPDTARAFRKHLVGGIRNTIFGEIWKAHFLIPTRALLVWNCLSQRCTKRFTYDSSAIPNQKVAVLSNPSDPRITDIL